VPPQKVYISREFPKVFGAAGVTGAEILFTPTSLANNTGRVSSQWDRGDSPAADRFIWRAATKVATTPALDKYLTIYLVTSPAPGGYVDGNLGTTDAALPSLDRVKNAQPIGSIVIDLADVAQTFTKSGEIIILERIVQVVWLNEFGVALSATDADHHFSLTPAPLETQS
jgi:hypothetical protein